MNFASEYDAYMRPVEHLGRCRFKGGSSHTTTVQERNIPAQTAREAALENDLYNYSTRAINQSQDYLNRANSAINNLPAYNWQAIQNSYDRSANNALNNYTYALNNNNANYQSILAGLNNQSNVATGAYSAQQRAANNAYQAALADATRGTAQTAAEYQRNLANLRNDYNAKTAGVNNGYADLIAGKLPSVYAAARRAALKDDLEKSVGNTVSSMANRGIMNSSITDQALNDISQNASDTLAKQYTNDLTTAANLLAQGNNQYENWFKNNAATYADAYNAGINRYNTQATNSGNAYNAASGTNKGILDAARANLSTQAENANSGYSASNTTSKNVYDSAVQNLKDSVNMATVTQNAGLALPAAYLEYANELYSPAQNLYNNMYNGRMGTGTTSSSTSQSGPSRSSQMWGLAGTLGSAAIFCFTGDTLVTTPKGYKEIKDVKAGDTVLSLDDDDNIIAKRVKSTNEAHEQEIWEVCLDDGSILHTTRTQRLYCAPFFEFAPQAYFNQMTVVTRHGIARVIRVCNTGRKATVYDFTLEGSRAKNIFFAEDVAVEGF